MNIKHKTIDRVRITGPMEESGKALDYCYRHDYSVIRSGPKRVSIGKVDKTRFAITAERVVSNSNSAGAKSPDANG